MDALISNIVDNCKNITDNVTLAEDSSTDFNNPAPKFIVAINRSTGTMELVTCEPQGKE